jgi:outer membrane protein OmpA-like peptidoglycan-associated protein
VVQETASVVTKKTQVKKIVDIRNYRFSRTISGFRYKSWTVEDPRVAAALEVAVKEIVPLLKKIQAHPEAANYKVQVIGHTDGIGPEEPEGDKPGNIAISRMRAQAIVDYLVKKYGLSPELFEVVAKGSSELKLKDDKESRLNRRVVIRFSPE